MIDKAAEAVRVAIARGATPESIARAALDAVLAEPDEATVEAVAKNIAANFHHPVIGGVWWQACVHEARAALSALHDLTRG